MCINSLKAFEHFDAMELLQQQIEAAETQAALARSTMQMTTATTQQGLSKDEGFCFGFTGRNWWGHCGD